MIAARLPVRASRELCCVAEELRKAVPDWDRLYREYRAQTLPWFYDKLDPDLRDALERHSLHTGEILDLGTGPGSQAIALAKLGFTVTATDVSAAAIEQAALRALHGGVSVRFKVDDILATKLDGRFDGVFDRGCLHGLQVSSQPAYVDRIVPLLKEGGLFFLKCFSRRETQVEGPQRFEEAEIRDLFGGRLAILEIRRAAFQGTTITSPEALFCVLQRPPKSSSSSE